MSPVVILWGIGQPDTGGGATRNLGPDSTTLGHFVVSLNNLFDLFHLVFVYLKKIS
jgi:hypothetical protein